MILRKLMMAAAAGFVLTAADAFSADVISAEPGKAVQTFGWADTGKIAYADAKEITVIDDATYPDQKAKKEAFLKAAGSLKPTFIVLSGDIDLNDGLISDADHSYYDQFSSVSHQRLHDDNMFSIGSNTTIIGVNNARLMYGGFSIRDASNVIIRNVTFYDAHGSTEYDTRDENHMSSKASIDALTIRDSKNVWIDHCTFTDGVCEDLTRNYNHDGQLDIPSGKGVTISYCEFTNHDKVMLVGSGEKSLNPDDRQVTLHHNYFHKTTQRTPRTRGTYMHIYNNVYDQIGYKTNPGYSIGPGTNGQFIVENNYFGEHKGKIVDWYDQSSNEGQRLKYYESGNNVLSYSTSIIKGFPLDENIARYIVKKPSWKIPYSYKAQKWEDAKKTVLENAGAGKEVAIPGYNK